MLTHHHQGPAPTRLRACDASEFHWTRAQLVRACANGDVAGIAAVNLTVQFVLQDGLNRGYVIRNDGGVQRFESDQRAWAFVDQIHARAEQTKRSRSTKR